MILRLLNAQGIAGLAASLCLALLLVLQKGETRHWKKQSSQFEQLYRGEQSIVATTVANYRAAAATARAGDKANADRAAAEQQAINQRSESAFETRLADARARAFAAAQRLRNQPETAANPRIGRSSPMPVVSAASGGADQAAVKSGLPSTDALIATEQAIQLDELIKWVKAQAKVDNNSPAVTSARGD